MTNQQMLHASFTMQDLDKKASIRDSAEFFEKHALSRQLISRAAPALVARRAMRKATGQGSRRMFSDNKLMRYLSRNKVEGVRGMESFLDQTRFTQDPKIRSKYIDTFKHMAEQARRSVPPTPALTNAARPESSVARIVRGTSSGPQQVFGQAGSAPYANAVVRPVADQMAGGHPGLWTQVKNIARSPMNSYRNRQFAGLEAQMTKAHQDLLKATTPEARQAIQANISRMREAILSGPYGSFNPKTSLGMRASFAANPQGGALVAGAGGFGAYQLGGRALGGMSAARQAGNISDQAWNDFSNAGRFNMLFKPTGAAQNIQNNIMSRSPGRAGMFGNVLNPYGASRRNVSDAIHRQVARAAGVMIPRMGFGMRAGYAMNPRGTTNQLRNYLTQQGFPA